MSGIGDAPLDEVLLRKVMASVHLEVRIPMTVRISKTVKGKLRDVHVMEVDSTAEVAELQRKVMAIARGWKGGFEVGTVYTVERVA